MAGIYIHIPFCKQACNYCNFHFSTSLRYKTDLVTAIVKEIELKKEATPKLLKTIYIGGGTPSLLTIDELKKIFAALHLNFDTSKAEEITLEANPDDINETNLLIWKEIGINRLSIGIQSFFDEDLRWMNRAHNALQSHQALQLATQLFNNISIDLIYGTPTLTNEKWEQNVQTIINLGIAHISCYALTVEPNTPLHKQIKLHKKEAVDAEKQAQQFIQLMQWLKSAGYEHYEISNFSLPGKRSQHNSAYWKGLEYTGIGPGAHSYYMKQRMWNVSNNQRYIQSINEGSIPQEIEYLTDTQIANEKIMIQLRTMEGLSLTEFDSHKTEILSKKLKKYEQQQLIVLKNHCAVLTNQGKLFADGIAADLFFL